MANMDEDGNPVENEKGNFYFTVIIVVLVLAVITLAVLHHFYKWKIFSR